MADIIGIATRGKRRGVDSGVEEARHDIRRGAQGEAGDILYPVLSEGFMHGYGL